MDATPLPAAKEPPPAPSGEEQRVTPLMEQYVEIKAANPDCLLFYRMGDFYELFFGDAEVASRALGIVLTKRGKHRGQDIPMCGVPIERADEYLHRLIALGHRVAVCEQTEDPAEARKARRQERGAPRRGAAGDAGHPDRGFAPRCPAQQLSRRHRTREAVGGGRQRLRARLPRHLHRRVPPHRMRPQRAAGGAGAARARRDHRVRRAVRRPRAGAAAAGAAG